jgi:hypothetical protein
MFAKYLFGKARYWLPPSLLLGCALTIGCASWNRAPDGAQPESEPASDTSWGAQFRKGGPDGQQLGLDPRAREIERSLGVRP